MCIAIQEEIERLVKDHLITPEEASEFEISSMAAFDDYIICKAYCLDRVEEAEEYIRDYYKIKY